MKKTKALLFVLGLLQLVLGLRVVKRLLLTSRGERLHPASLSEDGEGHCLSVIVPVLNECTRLTPCLEGLLTQGGNVGEILVVDGGSSDGTQELVRAYTRRDARVRLLDASPVPFEWNGKAWGLQYGLQHVAPTFSWVLTIDADVRPAPLLACSLLAHAHKTGLAALSIATLQEIAGAGQGLVHPALLTTLVYRYGIPGRTIHTVSDVQANGQCFLCRREVLEACGGFLCAYDSLCEDVTLARTLVTCGHAVGFYEAGSLASVCMYKTWCEAWQNWTRSLPMHDRFTGGQTFLGWLEVTLVQALPLPLFLILVLCHSRARWLLLLNGIGAGMRVGVLCGTMRAYRQRPWSYWLSPLCDLSVAFKLGCSALQRRHIWRGRPIVRGGLR
jgi:dolichol-phosphate mannosyltransferase